LDGRYLKAAQLLGEKKVREAIWELYQAGRVKAIKGKERTEYYAKRILESLNGPDTVAISQITHRENDAVSEIVRAGRKELGQLSAERILNAHRSLHWTPAQKREIHRLEPGMILQSTRGSDKGHAWTVLKVADGKAHVEDKDGVRTAFTSKHAGMFDVCVPRALPMAIGDHMLIYSGGKDVVNGETLLSVDGIARGTRSRKMANPSRCATSPTGTQRQWRKSRESRNIRRSLEWIGNLSIKLPGNFSQSLSLGGKGMLN
jgi:hypothetical protein